MAGTAFAESLNMIAAKLATNLPGRMDEAKFTRLQSKIMFISGAGFLADAS